MILVKNPISREWEQVAGNFIGNANAPIGAIFPFGGSSAPSGYLMCDGSAVSRTDYSALFAVIGTNFGAGDGSTTFNVPDLREATTKGVGLSGKSSNHYDSDGVALGEFIEDRLQGHEHKAYANASKAVFTAAGGSGMDNRTSLNTNGIVTDGSNGDPRTGTTTEVKAVGVNYIIKAKDVNLSGGGQALADRVSALESKTPEVRSGIVTMQGVASNNEYVYNITFSSPMPNTSYSISLQPETMSTYWADQGFSISGKTVNGFSIRQYNRSAGNFSPTNSYISWTAISAT